MLTTFFYFLSFYLNGHIFITLVKAILNSFCSWVTLISINNQQDLATSLLKEPLKTQSPSQTQKRILNILLLLLDH